MKLSDRVKLENALARAQRKYALLVSEKGKYHPFSVRAFRSTLVARARLVDKLKNM